MSSSKGLSFPVIIIIGSIISTVLIVALFIVHFINLNFKPSIKNVERLMQKGRFEEALFCVREIGSESSEISLLKAEILLFKTLQHRKDEGWRKYGTDEADWFKSEEIDSAIIELKNIAETDKGKNLEQAHYYLGQIYSEKGWYSEAENLFLSTLQMNKDHRDAKLALSSLYTKLSRFSEAENLLRSSFYEKPKDPDVAKNMAYLYRYYIDMPESAIVWFNRYLNNSRPRDLDINHCKTELEDLIQRYPEYSPKEPQNWRKQGKKFTARTK